MELSRRELYEKFQNGLKPDEDDFKDLIDSSFNKPQVNLNAGWHYFRFLPNQNFDIYGPNIMLIDDNTIIFTNGTSTSSAANYSGQMNIPIPRGVSRILQCSTNGRTSNNDPLNDHEMRFEFVLTAKLGDRGGHRRVIIRESVTETRRGRHEQNHDFFPTNDGAIDSETDVLYLQVSVFNPKGTAFTLRTFGIDFEV